MGRLVRPGTRAVSPVVGVVLLVAIVATLAAAVGLLSANFAESAQPVAPVVDVSHTTVTDGAERTVEVTLATGEPVRADRLYVTASTDLDIGGPPSSATPADEVDASARERFTESTGGNPPQVTVGETWDVGESVYLDPVGSAEGVTITIYWSSQPIQGVNPGSVTGADSYELVSFTA